MEEEFFAMILSIHVILIINLSKYYNKPSIYSGMKASLVEDNNSNLNGLFLKQTKRFCLWESSESQWQLC